MPTEWVFFDGDCGFCHRWVRLVVKHDHNGRAFRFAPRKVHFHPSRDSPPLILVLHPVPLHLNHGARKLVTKMETKTNQPSDVLHSSDHSKLSAEEIAKAVARHNRHHPGTSIPCYAEP